MHVFRWLNGCNRLRRSFLINLNKYQNLTGLPSTSLAWGGGWHQDKEAHGLSSALVNSNNLLCLLTPLSPTYSRPGFKKYWSILFLNIFTLVALTHSSGNLFQSFTTLWENVYFLISNLEWLFTKARLCPLVMLSFFILKNISLFNPSYPCIILKTSIWSPRIRLVSRVVNLHCWRRSFPILI